MSKFVKNNSGVHLTHPSFDTTFCGQPLEGWDKGDGEITKSTSTNETIVSCLDCIGMIMHCRGVSLAGKVKGGI